MVIDNGFSFDSCLNTKEYNFYDTLISNYVTSQTKEILNLKNTINVVDLNSLYC